MPAKRPSKATKPLSDSTSPSDPVATLKALYHQHRDPIHAEFHKAYHKSDLDFHGLKTDVMRSLFKQVFPPRAKLTPTETKAHVAALWASSFHEERCAALELLPRIATDLTFTDLKLLKRMTTECHGWGLLDTLACNTLGPACDALGPKAYAEVRNWTKHPHMWTRRASVICHILPSRKNRLNHDTAWETWEVLLPETDFFMRKAIGWATREASKNYANDVHAFFLRVGDRASGLTRREGARNLPPKLRKDILGP